MLCRCDVLLGWEMCLHYHDNGRLLDDGSDSNGRHCTTSGRHIPLAWRHGHKTSMPELLEGMYMYSLHRDVVRVH